MEILPSTVQRATGSTFINPMLTIKTDKAKMMTLSPSLVIKPLPGNTGERMPPIISITNIMNPEHTLIQFYPGNVYQTFPKANV